MKRPLALLMALLILGGWTALVTPLLAADAASEKEKLQGTWKSFSYEASGAVKDSRSVSLTIADNLIEAIVGDDVGRFEFDLDIDASPKEIDLVRLLGKLPMPERTDKGIYSLSGDELTICFGGQTRPEKFAIRPNSDDSLIKLKRQRAPR